MITEELKANDQVMVVAPPKHGTGDAADRIYTMGGQPWVINAFNDEEKMRVAIDFMNWWYLPETALEFARRGGNPADRPTLTADGFDDINPWNRAYKYMLEPGRSRDFWHHPKYAEMLAVQQEAFSSYMTGQTADPMQALNYAACSQQQILFDAGSASRHPAAPHARLDVGPDHQLGAATACGRRLCPPLLHTSAAWVPGGERERPQGLFSRIPPRHCAAPAKAGAAHRLVSIARLCGGPFNLASGASRACCRCAQGA